MEGQVPNFDLLEGFEVQSKRNLIEGSVLVLPECGGGLHFFVNVAENGGSFGAVFRMGVCINDSLRWRQKLGCPTGGCPTWGAQFGGAQLGGAQLGAPPTDAQVGQLKIPFSFARRFFFA